MQCCTGTVYKRETPMGKAPDGRKIVRVEKFHNHDYNCTVMFRQWSVNTPLPTDNKRL